MAMQIASAMLHVHKARYLIVHLRMFVHQFTFEIHVYQKEEIFIFFSFSFSKTAIGDRGGTSPEIVETKRKGRHKEMKEN